MNRKNYLDMGDTIKILFLEDNLDDKALIEQQLKKGGISFESEHVDCREPFRQSLRNFQPHVILADHRLPQFDSLEALKITKEHDANIAFILVTGAVSEQFAVRVMKKGADDYVLKSSLQRLPEAVKNALHKRKALQEKREAENTLFNFIHQVAHDMKGPLGSAAQLAKMAQEETKEPKSREQFSLIQETVQDLHYMLQSLVQRVSVKQENDKPQQVNVSKCAKRVINRLKFLKGQQCVDIDIDDQTTRSFYSRNALLECILQNLIENSIKYRDESKSKQWIQVQFKDYNEGIQFVVSDNGVGVAEEDQDKIFEKEFQSTQRECEGSGLGLYIVQEALQKLNGSIEVESTPGQGTTFTVELPDLKRVRQEESSY